MFSKTIKFKDFNDVPRQVEFYFHLGKADLMKMGVNGKLQEHLKKIVAAQDGVAIMDEFQGILAMSVGLRSEDGSEFHKSPEITSKLMSSPAYDELLVQLCTDAKYAEEFVSKLIPKAMVEELERELMKNAGKTPEIIDAPQPFDNPPNPGADLPLWYKEKREPTDIELREMSQHEMGLAFRMKGNFDK